MLPTPGSPVALDLKDIPRAPSPFLHGWASVNQKTYPYPFPQLTRPPSTPLESKTPLPTRKKPKAVNPFLPKQLIKPTTVHPATFNLPSQIKPPLIKVPEAENTTKKDSERKPEAIAGDDDSDDGWGLDVSPGDTAQAFIDRELDVLMNEDLKRIPPAMPNLASSIVVEEERRQFETDLRFDPDLLESVVRAALLSKILFDTRRQHAKRVTVLNDFKSATAGRNPEYATLYETELTTSVKAVEAVQAQLNSTLKFFEEDVKFQLEEFVVKHDRLLSETEPAVWVAKKPVKSQSVLPIIHPTRTDIATASASQQGTFPQADDTWASNSFQLTHSRAAAAKSGVSSSGLDEMRSSGGDEWGAAPSKPRNGTDKGAWGTGPKDSGHGQKSDWGNSGGGGFEPSGQRGRGSWGVSRGNSSGTGHDNSTGAGRGRGGSEMGNSFGGWNKKEKEDNGNGLSTDDWGGNNTRGGGNVWGSNDDSGTGSRGFGWASRGRGRGRGRGDENGGDSGWSAGGRGRGGNEFSGGGASDLGWSGRGRGRGGNGFSGGGGCDSGWSGRGRGRGSNECGGGFGSRGGASERGSYNNSGAHGMASFNGGDGVWGAGETGNQKSLGSTIATRTDRLGSSTGDVWGEEKKDKQTGEGDGIATVSVGVAEEPEEHSGWSP